MKREIKFRGKSIKSGEWLIGDYLRNRGLHFIAPPGIADPQKSWEDFGIDPETLGQYTGLKDKNGREIYEGDIVKYERDGLLYVVKFLDGMFFASVEEFNKGIFGGYPLHIMTYNEDEEYQCTVVGNILFDSEAKSSD